MNFQTNKKLAVGIASWFLFVSLGPFHLFADWPEHRGNLKRTGFVEQELASEHWQPYWQLDFLSPPEPAWPEPARGSLWQKLDSIQARVTDDQADVPLIARDRGGKTHVLITSSANDCLVSIGPTTGEVEWIYLARAPIRYAPSVADGIAYLGADDGIVRAVDIETGKEIWQSRIGPDMPWIVGNDRLISAHPIRTSVTVQDNQVFAAAGIFPSQGVYLVALDARNGALVWRKKTERSPQGYLLTDTRNLFIPTGRTQPFAVKKSDGQFMFDLPSPGGSFCMLTPEAFFAGPGNDSTIHAKLNQPGAKMLSFKGKQVVAGHGKIWTANGAKLVGHSIASISKKTDSPIWSVDCRLDQSLLVTGQEENLTLFVAGGSRIKFFDALNGKQKGELSVNDTEEKIRYLAASRLSEDSQEILLATTESGNVYAWYGVPRNSAKMAWPKSNMQPKSLVNSSDVYKQRVVEINKLLRSKLGLALVLGDDNGGLVKELLQKTELRIVSLVSDQSNARKLQFELLSSGCYGHRVSVWFHEDSKALPFSKGLFNVVIEENSTAHSNSDLLELVAPVSGFVSRKNMAKPKFAPALAGSGKWRHQYASPENSADSRDKLVGNAAAFRLIWFGGVGPSRMPDRHLRGPAPLSADGAAIMQGDGVLIGIDPANGTERWQLELPDFAMRYVTPFDAGYACLSESGSQLWVAANQELWKVDSFTGEILRKIRSNSEDLRWGYVATSRDAVYTSLMKTTAPRTAQDKKTRYSYVDSDYRSERPLVTSRRFKKLNLDGHQEWEYVPTGVICNGTIALNENRIIFVEADSKNCVAHDIDRIPMSMIMEKASLVCLDPKDANVVWKVPLIWNDARNILYAQLADGKIVLTSSKDDGDTAYYLVRVVNDRNGTLIWEREHRHIKPGLFHGEQVHHPVVLKRRDGKSILVAEPYLYDLESGDRIAPKGAEKNWALSRPGHSCGTLSGSGECLFFRASNPTVLNLTNNSFTALAPTRAGCWINMIPAGGRLLIPEGSASCVCSYSLQTSMAFTPVSGNDADDAIPILPNVLPQLPAESIKTKRQ